ncbi:MAG: DUF2341 domain-containing protein, partial [Bacteroidota bacterium]
MKPILIHITNLTHNLTNKRFYPLSRKIVLLAVALIFTQALSAQWLTGYAYRKTVTIPAAQVSGGPHTDFPVLVSVTDNDLRTIANGGYVENASGWDIVFSEDNINPLDHELESYNPVSGEVVAWVRIPSLPAGGHSFYLYFGNSSIGADPSTTSTWNGSYDGVWHLTGLADASGNGNNANNSFTTNTENGIISNARSIDGSGQYFQISQSTINNGDFSISLWFNTNDITDGTLFDLSNSASAKYFFSAFNSNSLRWYFECSNDFDAQTTYLTSLSTSSWYYVTVIGRYNSNFHELYLNGNFVGSSNVALTNKPSLNDIRVGAAYGYNPVFTHGDYEGRIDEFRISNIARSSGWILTEYNNQNAPGTFMSFGSLDHYLPQVFDVTGSG